MEKSLGEGDRLVLIILDYCEPLSSSFWIVIPYSSVACHEANLGQSIFETDILSCLCISHVGFIVPPCASLTLRETENN